MKIHLHPKIGVLYIILIFSPGINLSLFSQSNPAEIFSGQITNPTSDRSQYWLGNAQYKIRSISLSHDNDLFGLAAGSLNKDESYTGGFQLQLTMTPIFEKMFFRFQLQPEHPDSTVRYPGFDVKDCSYINNVSKFELGAQAYTPFDLESTEIVQEDRPYGSFHYLSFGLNSTILKEKTWRNDKKGRFMHRTVDNQIFIGIIGGYAAPAFQSFTHRFLKRETPNGWRNQVGGGKRSIAINYRVSNRFLTLQSKINKKMIKTDKEGAQVWRTVINASWHTITDFNIGSYATNIGIGQRFHFFEVNRGARISFKDEHSESALDFSKHFSSPEQKLADNWSFYIYTQAMLKAIIFDSMLQGTLFNDQSVHTIDYRQINPFRVDFSLGFALGIANVFNLFVDADIRSQEFLGGKKWHLFSRIGVNINLE